MRIELDIPDTIHAELTYLVKLQTEHGAPFPQRSVEALLSYAASTIADGSRRPGAWERTVLEMMGLVPEAGCDAYRKDYGPPK